MVQKNTCKSYGIPYKNNKYSQEMINAMANYMQDETNLQFHRKGEQCKLFENEFSKYFGRKHVISVVSGTAALHISLLACNIKNGDEVLLTPHVAYAVANSIHYVGAKPVFVDIDETLTIDPTKIEEKITPKTKAIIPIHTYGHPADMDLISEIAKKHDLVVIEDGTHAVGSRYKGRKLPVGGDKNIGAFSLTPKQLWLPSGGGIVVTDNEEIAEKISTYKNQHNGLIIGYSYSMADSAALIGRIQLRDLEKIIKMQRDAADILNNKLSESPIIIPVEKKWAYHSYARYTIRVKKSRDELSEFLKQKSIDCHLLYPKPTHLLKSYEKFGYKIGDFPVTEKEKGEELALPEPKFRSEQEIEYIAEKILDFYH